MRDAELGCVRRDLYRRDLEVAKIAGLIREFPNLHWRKKDDWNLGRFGESAPGQVV